MPTALRNSLLILLISGLIWIGIQSRCAGRSEHEQAVDSLNQTRPEDERARDSLQAVADAESKRADDAERRAVLAESKLDEAQRKLARKAQTTDSMAREMAAGTAKGVTWEDLYYRRTEELAESQRNVLEARRNAADFKGALDAQKRSNGALRAKVGRLEARLVRTEHLLGEAERGCRVPVLSFLECPKVGPGVVVSKEGVDLGVAAIVPVAY